ncbi:hypothetical protein [Sporichthya polymorpha]|uniref:hypothetical protein n=1 Tax=Sporichthya polymorpha TaxID=35751 RepID=UPI000363E728|nr:hypothetical protein [Sporichthya polymorpha]
MTTDVPSEPQTSEPIAPPAAAFVALPCSNCGGPLRYNPGRATGWQDVAADKFSDRDPAAEFASLFRQSEPQLRCISCGHTDPIAVEETAVADRELPPDEESDVVPTRMPELRCPACAANPLTTAENVGGQKVATACASCGASLVRADLPGAQWWRIDGVLPLLVDEDTARERMLEQCSLVRCAPKNRALYRKAELTLHYLPVIQFSADTITTYAGRVGRTHRDRDDHSTSTTWEDVSGTLELPVEVSFFTDPKVEEAIPRGQVSRVPLPIPGKWRRVNTFEPIFSPNAAVAFGRDYLAGLEAYLPQGSFSAYRRMADQRIHDEVRSAVKLETGGDRHEFSTFDARATNWRYRLVLVPVYLASVEVRGQQREVWVDGATGVAIVETPGSLLGLLYALVLVVLIFASVFVAAGAVLGLLWLVTWPLR